jgi:hypothetical protein
MNPRSVARGAALRIDLEPSNARSPRSLARRPLMSFRKKSGSIPLERKDRLGVDPCLDQWGIVPLCMA